VLIARIDVMTGGVRLAGRTSNCLASKQSPERHVG
jgi:hypothetical protein